MFFDLWSRVAVEYALNALWQVPLLAAAGWLLARAMQLRPAGEHRLWLAVLGLCVALPLNGIVLPERVRPASVRGAAAETAQLRLGATVPFSAQTATAGGRQFDLQRSTRLEVSQGGLRCFGAMYAALISLALLRLARASLGARRLMQSSAAYAMDEAERALWEELHDVYKLKLPGAAVRTSRQIASPVVVGVLRPVLLVPASFADCPEAERRAALAHEVAHIVRRDTLTHAVCQVLGAPLVWHPALHAVQRQIARTREMICDAMAARWMPSEYVYARCLLSLARHLLRDGSQAQPGAAMGLFRNRNKLEDRVMKLTESKLPLSTVQRWARGAMAGVAVVLAGAAATPVHLTPVMAQAATPGQTQEVAPAAPVPAAATPGCTERHSCAGTSPGSSDGVGSSAGKGKSIGAKQPAGNGHTAGAAGSMGPAKIAAPDSKVLGDDSAGIAQAREELGKAVAGLNADAVRGPLESLSEEEIATQLEQVKNLPELRLELKDLDPEGLTDFDFSGPPVGDHSRIVIRNGQIGGGKLSDADRKRIDQAMQRAKQRLAARMAKLKDPAFAARLAEAQRQAALVNTPAFATQMASAEKRFQAAAKALDEAKKQLEEKPARP